MTGKSTTSRPRMSPGQVGRMLDKIGLPHQVEDDTHFMILCPFHANYHSAACSVAKDTGYFLCFNASCGARGEFTTLVEHVKGWDTFRVLRFVQNHKGDERTFEEVMKEVYAASDELKEFDPEIFSKMRKAFHDHPEARDYMHWRGFNDDTLEYFQVGYDPNRGMIMVPMFDTDSRCVGVIGRSIREKRFKNSKDLPTKKTLFNINNAKKAGVDRLVLVESSFDAMRIHQAGFPNVCATLGGTYSDYHVTQVQRHFDYLVSMIDNDTAGLAFHERIAKKTKRARVGVYRGAYSGTEFLPNGAKDVCDQDQEGNLLVSEADIRQAIDNADFWVSDDYDIL